MKNVRNTIMSTKVKLKRSDRQTNTDEYRVTVHKILQNIIPEQIFEMT